MLVISKRLKLSLGINIRTIPIRIDNLLVWDLALADALAALTVLIVLTALAASAALTALTVFAAQIAPDAAEAVVAVKASKPIRLVFYLRETRAFLQGSFTIRKDITDKLQYIRC